MTVRLLRRIVVIEGTPELKEDLRRAAKLIRRLDSILDRQRKNRPSAEEISANERLARRLYMRALRIPKEAKSRKKEDDARTRSGAYTNAGNVSGRGVGEG